MPRLLVMCEQVITEAERQEYVDALAARRERAATANANFWVFEQQGKQGRFLEFVEAGSLEELQAAIAAVAVAGARRDNEVVWREVKA